MNTRNLARHDRPLPSQVAGLSLVEMMIGMTLGLMVIATVTVLFVNNNRVRRETEKTSEQIENGRYATQLLLEDLRLAGYYGEFNPGSLPTPATVPDPSATDAVSLAAAMPLPIQGYDGGTGLPAGVSTLLTDRRTGSDVLVVRRASTCVAGDAGCDAFDTSANTYFQTTLCQTQLSSLTAATRFLIGTDSNQFISSNPAVIGSAAPPTFLAKKDCVTPAVQRTFIARIYFVANNNQSGDAIPTLKVAELRSGQFTIAPLVAGIDQLQIEYGLDTNGDGEPNVYAANPATATAWRQVTAVKVHSLARNSATSGGFTDTRTYVLGLKADGTDNSFGPYADAYKRHAYTTVTRLNNVAGRLE